MQRREFITVLAGGAISAWPLRAHAQQVAGAPTIGFLGSGTASSQRDEAAAFAQRLGELGWAAGSSANIAYGWAEGRTERYGEIAAGYVASKVNVIVASGPAAVAAARLATPEIPIVFAVVNDPLETGVVKSLGRPGGNVTGLSLENRDLAGKRLELLTEAVTNVRRLAILLNGRYPGAVVELAELRTMIGKLGLRSYVREIRRREDIATVLRTLGQDADALYVCSDPLTIGNRTEIAALALAARVPTIHGPREFAEAGGLISYGPNIPELFRRAAGYVDRILRGAKPAEMPVEPPAAFSLTINQKSAGALGIAIALTVLGRADEVIK
jgi:putative tryptophan/tyrosine transport system substrate-binding protein